MEAIQEHRRLPETPYLSERQWGTVREDYRSNGDPVRVFPARPCALAGLPLERRRTGASSRVKCSLSC